MNKEIEIIWNNFHKELRSFIVSKVGNKNDADDILQNAFVKILKNQEKVTNAKDVRQYLYGIIRNTTIDFYRSKKAPTLEVADLKLTDEESNSLNNTIAECCIKPFIDKLPEKYREALKIAELSDVSQKELAKQLNISYSGLKSRVQRGRIQLKELISECCSLESDSYGNLSGDENQFKDC